jgi:hypothetical protein
MAIKYGTSRSVASLSTGDQTKLWDSVNNSNLSYHTLSLIMLAIMTLMSSLMCLDVV